jgi:hypothetical protein
VKLFEEIESMFNSGCSVLLFPNRLAGTAVEQNKEAIAACKLREATFLVLELFFRNDKSGGT